MAMVRFDGMEAHPASSADGPSQVSKSHFKAHALQLFREVEASGEPLVVTDHGRPTLELRTCRPGAPPAADSLEQLHGSVLHFDDPFAPVAVNDWDALA